MGIINDCLDSALEKELEDLLHPFVQESDYVSDPWRAEPVFDYTTCIRRVVASLLEQQDRNKEEVVKWQRAVEDALGLEHDSENHTPEWAYNIILQIREIGNRK